MNSNFLAELAAVQQPRDQYTIIRPEFNAAAEQTLTDQQRTLLQSFIQIFEKEYPHDVKDTWTLIRYLEARDWNIKQAEEMYRKRLVRCSLVQACF